MSVPKRTDEVVLYQNDDQHELDDLRRAIKDAVEASPTPMRLGDDDDVLAAAEAYDTFKAAAAERGVKVTFKTIGRKWRTLVVEHPPRKDNAADEGWGFNEATFPDAVVPLCVTAIGDATEPDKVQAEIDELSDGDFQRIYEAVRRLNTGRGPDPTVSISGTLRRTSPEISESPERLG